MYAPTAGLYSDYKRRGAVMAAYRTIAGFVPPSPGTYSRGEAEHKRQQDLIEAAGDGDRLAEGQPLSAVCGSPRGMDGQLPRLRTEVDTIKSDLHNHRQRHNGRQRERTRRGCAHCLKHKQRARGFRARRLLGEYFIGRGTTGGCMAFCGAVRTK